MTYAQGLIDMLVKYPAISRVFINDNGEWLFSPANGFKEISREDVLEGEKPAITTETTLSKKSKKDK